MEKPWKDAPPFTPPCLWQPWSGELVTHSAFKGSCWERGLGQAESTAGHTGSSLGFALDTTFPRATR